MIRRRLDHAQRQRLLDYLQLIAKWNKVYNLTAVRDPEEMLTAHLFDSLAVIAPLRNADWRWLLNRSDSPWYPSARLFRQDAPGDWASVTDAIQRELPAFLTGR